MFSFSITLLTSVVHENPCFVSLRKNSNTQVDFFEFLCHAISLGYITPGDFVVLDNASVHKGRYIKDEIDALLETYQFKLIFLPTYSPELNPCELVFNVVKNFMRHHKREDVDFRTAIIEAFAQIDVNQMLAFYMHCQRNLIALDWRFLQNLVQEEEQSLVQE